ncbi:MAG: pyridoxamine 5'-phosphate oxidase family protein [Actinomycetota bacterium]|nr:pyridoxamine 5'-phosphate oxidase family protein [Actinomycetota bacterium]
MSDQTTHHDEQLETVRSIMKDVRTCMFVTSTDNGDLHAAPMTTQEAEFDGDAWFIAQSDSETVRNLTAHPRVNVSYSGATSWVSLGGTAAVVDDVAKKKELWNTFTEAWFPKGQDNPTVVVVKVSGDSAQYWDSPGRVAMTMSMVKARVSGTTPQAGESATVDL